MGITTMKAHINHWRHGKKKVGSAHLEVILIM